MLLRVGSPIPVFEVLAALGPLWAEPSRLRECETEVLEEPLDEGGTVCDDRCPLRVEEIDIGPLYE